MLFKHGWVVKYSSLDLGHEPLVKRGDGLFMMDRRAVLLAVLNEHLAYVDSIHQSQCHQS